MSPFPMCAAEACGDAVWRLPLQQKHRDLMKGHVADLKNTGPREGGALTAVDAAKAKYWCSELQVRAADLGVQLHGGAGYMHGMEIERLYRDARVQAIGGGATEVMLEEVAKRM